MTTVAAAPERLNASTLLDENLDAGRADKVALITEDSVLTYSELASITARVATYLQGIGVQREQRVLMVLDDSPAFVATFLAAMRIGAVPVPVNPMDRVDNHVFYLEDSYAGVVFVEAVLQASLQAMLSARPDVHVVVVGGDGPHGGGGPHAGGGGAGDGVGGDGVGGGGGSRVGFDAVIAEPSSLAAPADTHRDDMAFWLYSSGSTGRPKGVVHAHRDIGVTVNTYARHVLGISAEDTCYSTTKLYHAYGLGNSLSFPLSVGGSAVLVRGRAMPERIFETVARHRPTLFFSVPALYAAMVKAGGGGGGAVGLGGAAGGGREVDFSSVRACVSAAEALPAAILARWQALTGVPILDGIGSTEMLHIYCSNTLDELTPGTSGRPVPGYELRVVDEAGAPVPAGQPGDLLVRGESCAAMYWHQREKTRHCMRGEWFYTADRYVETAEGRFVYQGRADDMIKSGGLWVSPADVEACLALHPAVSEAAVIGVHVDGLSRIKAFVICGSEGTCRTGSDPEALADELRGWCKQHLRRYEYPHLVEFVEDLPRTATGKIQRFKLREMEESRAVEAATGAAAVGVAPA